MSPGARALKQLRAARVTAVECTVTPGGKLVCRATFAVGDRAVVLRGRRMDVNDLLEEPMSADANVSAAAERESRRLQSELSALLRANPTYAEHQERRALRNLQSLTRKRANDLAAGAARAGMRREELTDLVRDRWDHHYAKVVMES